MLDTIEIHDGNKHINIYLNNNKIYVFSNDKNSNIYEYLNLLKTDNPTSFFSKGRNTVLYIGNGKETKKKIFNFGKIVIVLALSALITINSNNISDFKIFNYGYNLAEIDELKVSDLYSMIYSSTGLTKEEKDFLYNEDLLQDVLEMINKDPYLRNMYLKRFNNITITEMRKDYPYYEEAYGCYILDKPNYLFIKDYDKFTDEKKSVVAHEFVHMCQSTDGYTFIVEASAELIAHEYFGTTITFYRDRVKLLKKMMEIIGTRPIWVYNFTGDFSLIEERVKPYLSSEDYEEFLNDLNFSQDNKEENEIKYNSLNELLNKLYKAIYNDDIENNEIISIIEKGNKVIYRYYFNKRFINQENSYYIDYESGDYHTVSLDYAIKHGIVVIHSIFKTPIDTETALNLLDTEEKVNLERIIDTSSARMNINRTTYSHYKMYISGTINGVEYNDYDIDDLVKDGIIKVKYSLVDFRSLSAQEYLNHEYNENAELSILYRSDTIFNEDTVYGYIPKIVYLKLTSEVYEDLIDKTL